jgi:TRAP-type mannitol/chloroaromatic compound transport system permease small subunit
MNALLRLSARIDATNEWIGKIAGWFGLLAVVICTVNAVFRYAFNMSSNAWLEIQWYFNAVMFLLVAAWALKRNDHVRIDVIGGRLSRQTQAWIDIFGGLLALMPASLNIGEYSSDPGGLIRWPIRLLIPVAFTLLALQGASEIIKRIAFLKGLIPFPGEHAKPESA